MSHLPRCDSLGKTLMLGELEGRRRSRQRKMRETDGITDSMETNSTKLWEMLRTGKTGVWQSMGLQKVGYNLVIEQQN